MTYCVAMRLDAGLIFASDSRTNAGVDHISTFAKTNVFESAGERVMVLLHSGNLGTTQAVLSKLRRNIQSNERHLMNAESLFDCAEMVGELLRDTVAFHESHQQNQGAVDFGASFLLGGQIRGESPRLFQIYSQGNFIEATPDTCYFQIGESKYGKPIIDRVVHPDTPIDEAVKCALVSFDSTIKSNLSVGLPIDLTIVRTNQMAISFKHRITADDDYFKDIRVRWGLGLKQVFQTLPNPGWLEL